MGSLNYQALGLVGFGFLVEGLKLFWNFRLNIGAFINAYTNFFLFWFFLRGRVLIISIIYPPIEQCFWHGTGGCGNGS